MGQMRVIAEQVGFCPAGSEHLQYQFDGDSCAADDWFSSQHLRIQDDPILPVHAGIVASSTGHMRIAQDGISRLHARLTPAGDEVLLEDMGSANGTWLNGKRITRAQAVHGDEIRFDTQRFQLLMPGQPVRAKAEGAPVASRRPWLVAMVLALAGVAYWLSR